MTPEFTDLRWRLVAEREYAAPTYRSTESGYHTSLDSLQNEGAEHRT